MRRHPADLEPRNLRHGRPRPASWLEGFSSPFSFSVSLALAISLPNAAAAQVPAALPPSSSPQPIDRDLTADFIVRSWRIPDGLPSDHVTCVVQAQDGYLWVGTSAGLARFDGLRFVRFDHGTVPQLIDHRIQTASEDRDGVLWVVNGENQLAVLGFHGWLVPTPGETSIDGAHRLRSLPDGTMLGRSGKGRWISLGFRQQGSSPGFIRIEPRSDLPDDAIERVEGLGGPRVVVTRDQVLVESTDGSDPQQFPLPPLREPHRAIAAAVRTGPDSVWILRGEYGLPTPFGLYHLAQGRLSTIDAEVPQPRSLPISLATDRGGAVWHAAGEAHVARVTPRERTRYRLPGAIANAHLLNMTQGLGGTLWLAVENAGLLEIRPRLFQGIRDTEGLPHPMVRSVLPDPRGGTWAGTDDGVAHVNVLPPSGAWRATPAGLSGHTVRALALDAEGTLWAGASRGLFTRRNGDWEERQLPRLPFGSADGDGLGSLKARDLLVGRAGDLWVVTAHQVALAPHPRSALSTVAFLPTLIPTDLLEDRDGCRWLATERAGVVVLGSDPGETGLRPSLEPLPGHPGNRWRCVPRAWLRETNGLPSDHVWELLEDHQGAIWMAGPRGLLRLPRPTARALAQGNGIPQGLEAAPFVFTPRHGLPELALNSLVDDGQGNLWIGGDLGVYRIAHASFQAVARGHSPALSVETYRSSDGLPADETNGRLSHPGAHRDAAGRIWMATIRGLACFSPESRTDADAGPGVAIEEVRSDGHVLATTLPQEPQGGHMAAPDSHGPPPPRPSVVAVRRLTHPVEIQPGGGRVLEIRFTGFDPNAPRALRFRYQLEGYDSAPQEIGDRRVAYFTNLDPGTYRFRVWASGHSGRWSPEPAELTLRLQPLFWQTWWFRILSGLSLAGLVLAAVAWRVRRIRQFEHLRRRAERAELRTRLARDLHDGVGSGLARLAVLAHLPEEDARHPDRVQRQFRDLSMAVRDLAQTVRELSWTARPSAISLESLIAQITQQASDFLGAAGIQCRTSLPLEFPNLQLDPEPRSDLYFAAKEAVTNVVRHSGATEARFDVELRDGSLVLSLVDNGRGLASPPQPTSPATSGANSPGTGGNGLPNLHARMASFGGRLTVEDGGPLGGTRVQIEVPIVAMRNLSPDPEDPA